METIKVLDVEQADSGWYEVTLEDGRKASTKNKAVADAAFESVGNPAEAEINEVKRGTFTNIYLNQINGVSDGGKPKGNGGSPKRSAAPQQTGGKDNERIARQWAYGRSVELLIDSGTEFSFPLTTEEFQKLQLQAEALLRATK